MATTLKHPRKGPINALRAVIFTILGLGALLLFVNLTAAFVVMFIGFMMTKIGYSRAKRSYLRKLEAYLKAGGKPLKGDIIK